MTKSHLAASATLLIALSNAHAQAADTDWHWVRVEPPGATSDWVVEEGTASFSFDGDKFSTILIHDTKGTWHHYQIKGTIHGDRVTAIEIQESTDAAPLTYQGHILRERTPVDSAARGWGFDRIDLHADAYFIGLYRSVPPSK
jgi:hypothetical protein